MWNNHSIDYKSVYSKTLFRQIDGTVLGKAILHVLHSEGQFCHDYCLRCKNHLFNYALAAAAGLYVNR